MLDGHTGFALGIVLALMVDKPLGILGFSWIAVRLRIAAKPEAITWWQLAGAGAFGGKGFTMSLFIAGQAFAGEAEFRAAKLAIFLASFIAGVVGVVLLRVARRPASPQSTEAGLGVQLS